MLAIILNEKNLHIFEVGKTLVIGRFPQKLRLLESSHDPPKLVQKVFEYVLTERFMQDFLKDYFGHQKGVDRTTQLLISSVTLQDIALVIRDNISVH